MDLSQPQSPFMKPVSQAEQNYLTKKVISYLQTDKENIMKENPQIHLSKMSVGQDQIDIYLLQIHQMLKLKRENTKDLIKGLVKEKQNKRVIIGISGQKPFPIHPSKQSQNLIASENLVKTKNKSLFNLSILLKIKSEQSPFLSMFSCNCLMAILQLYLQKNNADFKIDDLKIKWKYDFLLKQEKIGQIMIMSQAKGDQIFANIGIRLKLDQITKDQQSFSQDLLQQFASRLNISVNLRQTASKIKQNYESYMMDIGEQVFVKRRQPNQWQETISGRFVRVNQVGHAILQNEDGQEEQIQEGHMQRRGNADIETFKQQEKQEIQNIPVIQM